MKNYFVFFLLLFLSSMLSAQVEKDFYSLAREAVEKAYQNPDDAIKFSGNLLLNDNDTEHQIVMSQITALAYTLKGDYVQSVKASLERYDSGIKNLSPYAGMMLNYNLASQYQNFGLYRQSEKVIQAAVKEKQNNDIKENVTLAKFYQLEAINLKFLEKPSDAFRWLSKSNQYLYKNESGKSIFAIENTILEARLLLRTNRLKEAEKIMADVIPDIEKERYPYLYSLAYECLSKIYFSGEKYEEALSALEKADAEIKDLDYLPLKIKINEGLMKTYSALNDTEGYRRIYDLYTAEKNKTDASKKEGIRNIIKLTEKFRSIDSDSILRQQKKKFNIVLLISLIFVVSILFIWLYLHYQKRQLEKQQLIFDRLYRNINPDFSEENEQAENKRNKTSRTPSQIPSEVETEILRKLEEFEKSEDYLNKNMTLPTLAGQLETNTRYLSEIINTYKGKNFKMYINELRINHIVRLLATNPAFLNYKISYLAEYCGFTSHSTFSIVFKTITGMSPQEFINKLTKNPEL